MKKTINIINQGLAGLKEQKFNRIDKKVSDLKDNFITEQVKSFKIDLGNKTAQNTLAMWETYVQYKKSLKEDCTSIIETLDIDNEIDSEQIQYFIETNRIATRRVTASIRPITVRLNEMYKAVMDNNLKTFNGHMMDLFAIELSSDNFSRLKDIMLNGKSSGLSTMSATQFNNTFMNLMLARAIIGGAYSSKKVKGKLDQAMKDVPTLTYDEAMNITQITVEKMCKECGIKAKKGETFNTLADKVRQKFHTSIAIKPMSLVKVKNECEVVEQ